MNKWCIPNIEGLLLTLIKILLIQHNSKNKQELSQMSYDPNNFTKELNLPLDPFSIKTRKIFLTESLSMHYFWQSSTFKWNTKVKQKRNTKNKKKKDKKLFRIV